MKNIKIPKKLYPNVGDFEYVNGIAGGPYEIEDVYKLNGRTLFTFNIGGFERNAVINLTHYKEFGVVALIDAENPQ
jgi:hypothetical protein